MSLLTFTVLSISLVLYLLNRYLRKYWEQRKYQFQFAMLCVTLIAGVAVIVALPLSDTLKGQLLTLFGILLSAAIAFSSTTFIGNILAGFMLRAIKNVKLGDFVTVADVTGRATELNLLHVEVQTEQSDLVTIPNIHMVTYPVKVVRSSGTIVSVEVSLGYDVPRLQISKLLSLASEDAGLDSGVVHVKNLGDFAVTYRVSGQLKEVSSLLSVRSNLNAAILDRLHSEHIEIVSPNFMNTRSIAGLKVLPSAYSAAVAENNTGLETMAFDKAETVSSIVSIEKSIELLSSNLNSEKKTLSEKERREIESELGLLNKAMEEEKQRLEEGQVPSEV
ncbi:MAG: small conductance mechanosensitive channel [Halioglobus sp.]|jgi:small conductance mechanosensitive channel